MIIFFLLGLLLGGATVVFVLQNVATVTVTFFSWQLEGSLAAVLALAVFSGIVITLLLLLPSSITDYLNYKRLKKENVILEENLRKQKELTVFATKTPANEEIISKIEDGAVAHIELL